MMKIDKEVFFTVSLARCVPRLQWSLVVEHVQNVDAALDAVKLLGLNGRMAVLIQLAEPGLLLGNVRRTILLDALKDALVVRAFW